MRPAAALGLVAVAVAAAGTGWWIGRHGPDLDVARPAISTVVPGPTVAAPDKGPIVYWRDPDGRPRYAAAPATTVDGRAFQPVHAAEDLGLDDTAGPRMLAPTAGAARRILYYRNPMGLPDTSPVPRKDSMGMDYIAVYDGENDGDATIRLSPGKLQRTGVRTALVEMRVVARPVSAPGQIQYDERRLSVVATRSDAFVEEVADVTIGDRVVRGQPLVQLYAPDVSQAGAQFLTDLAGGLRNGGARQRLENLGVPAEVVAEIERTRRAPFAIAWRAPRDGVVLARAVAAGMKVGAGEVLFRIADTSMVWAVADVTEYELASVGAGAQAQVRVRSLPGRRFDGRVALIYPQLAPDTRTVRVRVDVPNPDGALLAGMYAEVEIAAAGGAPVAAVPDDAVIDTGTRRLVILARGEGRFEPRTVELGRRGGGLTEVREGVGAGERVVVAANFLIDAESNLKAALRAMAEPESRP